MDIINGIILGAVQGLTEFLPISSSGHLILTRDILNVNTGDGLAFDAVLQLATALAVLVYFRIDFLKIIISFLRFVWWKGRDMHHEEKVLLIALMIGTIPAVVFGLLLEGYMETVLRKPHVVAGTLVLGGIIMFFAERHATQSENLTIKKGLWIGLFQSLALIPGMSRSGMTISGGLFLGLSREYAAKFSFLLAFPIIFGSGMKKFFELSVDQAIGDVGLSLVVGVITAFIVGLLAIHFLLKFLRTNSMNIFVGYRIVLALIVVFFI